MVNVPQETLEAYTGTYEIDEVVEKSPLRARETNFMDNATGKP